MKTSSFSEVFSGDVDVLTDKDPTQPSNPSTPASGTLGSQPASSRQPQGQAGQLQVGRASVLPIPQVRPGRSTPHPTEGPLSQGDQGFEANVTDAFGQTAHPLTGLPAAAESVHAEARASRMQIGNMCMQIGNMWASSKSSSLSFRSSIRGGSTTELPFKNIIMWLVSLLPVADLAYTYSSSHWMKTLISSLPVFVSTMKRNYQQLHTAITNILKLCGEDCRAVTEDILDDLFGHFAGQIHSAFIYGVVVYVWMTAESPRQDELRQMLVRYLSTQQHRLAKFKAQCTNPTTATYTMSTAGYSPNHSDSQS